jgi:hypothetical protein
MNTVARWGLSLVLLLALSLAAFAKQAERLAQPKEAADPNSALVRVHLPLPVGRAWFQDQTILGGPIQFRTGKLEAGESTATVTAAWRLPNGLLVAEQRDVTFSAGKTVDVDFRKPGPPRKPSDDQLRGKEVEPIKPEPRKVEPKKEEPKKVEPKKEEPKKIEGEKKEGDKKPDTKKIEK